MKIENKYVKVKNGKNYEFRNTITNDYLKLFNKSQYDDDYKLLSKTEKELKYCYIKTNQDIGGGGSSNTYYNLLNVNDIESSDETFNVESNWIKYTGFEGRANIKFKNEGYVENGNDYKLLFAVKDAGGSITIKISNSIVIGHEWRHGQTFFTIFDYNSQIRSLSISPVNSVYYFAFHVHNLQNADDLFSIDVISEGSNASIQYSIIKETNNEEYMEQINNYEYSPYIDLTNLAGQYNYRLPVINDFAKGENIVEVNYTYNNVSGYSKSDGSSFNEITNINDIANQTLMQLAFGNEDTIYAFVDVSSCNITILENETLYIYRKDTFQSDALYSGNRYPAHLSPLGLKIDDYVYYGSLYSVGFGFSKGIMNEEYLISENPVTEIDDYTFQIELQRGYDETLTPHNNLQPNSNLYTVYETHEGEIHPSNSLQPSITIYPELSDYKYVIYKYKLYRISGSDIIYLDNYYTMSFYTTHKGQTYVNTRLERS